jgi:DNA-binding LytR/AlgR family response regulator
MNVLIVEDEQLLATELAERLIHLDNEIKIVGQTDSVASTVKWLQQNECDLIFLDIHLSDGISFSIFDKIKVSSPVIFTTAYDRYAIKAFEVNSIAYLLKPVNEKAYSVPILRVYLTA